MSKKLSAVPIDAPSLSASPNFDSQGAQFLDQLIDYLKRRFEVEDRAEWRYHGFKYLSTTVRAARVIGETAGLSTGAIREIEVAAALICGGYLIPDSPLKTSAPKFAEEYLGRFQLAAPLKESLRQLVELALEGGVPQTPAVAVLKDALNAHFGKKKFLNRADDLRLEIEARGKSSLPEEIWLDRLAGILKEVTYFTEYAQITFLPQKQAHIEELRRETVRVAQGRKQGEGSSGKSLEKGVDTFFRTQTKNMHDLVSLADRKAQMLIHINAVTASILLSLMSTKFRTEKWLIAPSIGFLFINLVTIGIAILAIQPGKVGNRKMSIQDLLDDRTAIATHTIFNDVSYEDFEAVVQAMMRDEPTLYRMLIEHIYGNGRVLRKKFTYIRAAYATFVYGLAASIVGFIIAMVAAHL